MSEDTPHHGHNPDREARRLAEAQQAYADIAEKGRNHPGVAMVAVFSIAGFELADIFAEWARRHADGHTGVLGPPMPSTCPVNPDRPGGAREHETPEQFGDRIARGILRLIKEV